MKRRTKIATILTTGLLSAALVGVGFAAWTITNAEVLDTSTGNVSVDTTVRLEKDLATTSGSSM